MPRTGDSGRETTPPRWVFVANTVSLASPQSPVASTHCHATAPSGCVGAAPPGIFQRNAVFSRRISALLHLTICFPRIRWCKRITPWGRKTVPRPALTYEKPRFKPFWRWYKLYVEVRFSSSAPGFSSELLSIFAIPLAYTSRSRWAQATPLNRTPAAYVSGETSRDRVDDPNRSAS
jgi:hypothetical protein